MQKITLYKKITLSLVCLSFLSSSALALELNGVEVKFNDIKSVKSTKKTRSLIDTKSYKTVIIKTTSVLNQKEIDNFYKNKIEAIVYAGDLSYYIYAKSYQIDLLLQKLSSNPKILSYSDMKSEYKISKSLQKKLLESNSDLIDIDILLFSEFSKDELSEYLKDIDLDIIKEDSALKSATLRLSLDQIDTLASKDAIQYIDLHIKDLTINANKKVRNFKTAKDIQVSTLWGNGYNLSGKGVSVGVVDGGRVLTTHQELSGRVHVEGNNPTVNRHSTHVAGTIGAKGIDSSARGMANEVEIYSYSFSDVAFSSSITKMYNQRSILLSNHSYGYSDQIKLGEYDDEARKQDQLVRVNPYINIFQAAGNDGDDINYPDFGFIKGPANSKNIFTIGALNSSSSDVATLSSKGPALDGRIKPDLVVRGEFVKSTDALNNNSYVWMSGTSMATPAATGVAALLMQEYKEITKGDNIRHDTLKSILINTAIDVANPGPDYKAGFGMINAKAAADLIKSLSTSTPLIVESDVANEGIKVYSFKTDSTKDFKTTISWVDPAANPSSSKALVNDIDMWLQDNKSGKIYYPYSLNKDNPNAIAVTNHLNKVDNIEQIEIKNLPAGEYSLFVKGAQIVEGNSQEYAIVSNTNIFNANADFIKKQSLIRNFARVIYLN